MSSKSDRRDYMKEYNAKRKEKRKEYDAKRNLRKKVEKLDFCTKTEKPEPVYFDYRHNFIWTLENKRKSYGSGRLKDFMIYDRSEYHDRAVF